MPQISVILPVSNGEKTIQRAIKSILSQTFSDFELIVINNGSTDKTNEILHQFSDKRIRRYNLPDKNLVNALNHGISASNGKYIARMDADDESMPHRLADQLTFLDDHPEIGLVSGQVQYAGNKQRNQGYYAHVNWINTITDHIQIYLSRFVESPLAHPSVMFRSDLIKKYGTYRDSDFPEDYELWLRWLHCGVKMGKVRQTVIQWYDHDRRLSRTHAKYDPDRFHQLKATYFLKWLGEKYTPSSYPDIFIWGRGSSVRRKSGYLIQAGLKISGYIDLHPKQSSNAIYYKDLKKGQGLVLNYVSNRKGRLQIHDYLIAHGFEEGVDFYMMN